MIQKLGGRKTVLGLLLICIGTAIEMLTLKGMSSNLMTLMLGLYGTFALGNGAEHLAKNVGQKKNDAANNQAVLAQIDSSMRQMAAGVELANAAHVQSNAVLKQVQEGVARVVGAGRPR